MLQRFLWFELTMHKFSPNKAFILEDDGRYVLLQPEKTLRQFGLREGMTIVDIGAGTGFFSRAASNIVGEKGTVYAADISSEMLDAFRRFSVPNNVQLLQSNEYEVPVPSAQADLVLFAFVLHESEDIPRFLKEAMRLMKPDGSIAIIEWKKQEEEHGPSMEERLSKNDLLSQCKGFTLLSSAYLNPSHYSCILQVD
jgi:ubiquinone/menaquinone biosynthesis C-methylase UbiE